MVHVPQGVPPLYIRPQGYMYRVPSVQVCYRGTGYIQLDTLHHLGGPPCRACARAYRGGGPSIYIHGGRGGPVQVVQLAVLQYCRRCCCRRCCWCTGALAAAGPKFAVPTQEIPLRYNVPWRDILVDLYVVICMVQCIRIYQYRYRHLQYRCRYRYWYIRIH